MQMLFAGQLKRLVLTHFSALGIHEWFLGQKCKLAEEQLGR